MTRPSLMRSLRELINSDKGLRVCHNLARIFTGLTVVYTAHFVIYRISFWFNEFFWLYETLFFRLLTFCFVMLPAHILYPEYMTSCTFGMGLYLTSQRLALICLSLALTFWGAKRAIERKTATSERVDSEL